VHLEACVAATLDAPIAEPEIFHRVAAFVIFAR
jgi:hypothetical protein